MLQARTWAIFFFFQAEDGIRDIGVTGVQTCALPILVYVEVVVLCARRVRLVERLDHPFDRQAHALGDLVSHLTLEPRVRSEERRVGKECRSRWSPYH